MAMDCGDPCTVHGELEFHPPSVWGLDYHFTAYKKMYIHDIINMQPYPHYTGGAPKKVLFYMYISYFAS